MQHQIRASRFVRYMGENVIQLWLCGTRGFARFWNNRRRGTAAFSTSDICTSTQFPREIYGEIENVARSQESRARFVSHKNNEALLSLRQFAIIYIYFIVRTAARANKRACITIITCRELKLLLKIFSASSPYIILHTCYWNKRCEMRLHISLRYKLYFYQVLKNILFHNARCFNAIIRMWHLWVRVWIVEWPAGATWFTNT